MSAVSYEVFIRTTYKDKKSTEFAKRFTAGQIAVAMDAAYAFYKEQILDRADQHVCFSVETLVELVRLEGEKVKAVLKTCTIKSELKNSF